VIHLLSGSGAEVMVEARLRPEWVEVWFAGRLRAVLARQALKTWLACPIDALVVEDVVWTVSGTGQISLALADVGVWPVRVHVWDGLRARL
jgi:hypothetical protein